MKLPLLFAFLLAGSALAGPPSPAEKIYRVSDGLLQDVQVTPEHLYVKFDERAEIPAPAQKVREDKMPGCTFMVMRGKSVSDADWRGLCDPVRLLSGQRANIALSGLSFMAFTKPDGVRAVFTAPLGTMQVSSASSP